MALSAREASFRGLNYDQFVMTGDSKAQTETLYLLIDCSVEDLQTLQKDLEIVQGCELFPLAFYNPAHKKIGVYICKFQLNSPDAAYFLSTSTLPENKSNQFATLMAIVLMWLCKIDRSAYVQNGEFEKTLKMRITSLLKKISLRELLYLLTKNFFPEKPDNKLQQLNDALKKFQAMPDRTLQETSAKIARGGHMVHIKIMEFIDALDQKLANKKIKLDHKKPFERDVIIRDHFLEKCKQLSEAQQNDSPKQASNDEVKKPASENRAEFETLEQLVSYMTDEPSKPQLVDQREMKLTPPPVNVNPDDAKQETKQSENTTGSDVKTQPNKRPPEVDLFADIMNQALSIFAPKQKVPQKVEPEVKAKPVPNYKVSKKDVEAAEKYLTENSLIYSDREYREAFAWLKPTAPKSSRFALSTEDVDKAAKYLEENPLVDSPRRVRKK